MALEDDWVHQLLEQLHRLRVAEQHADLARVAGQELFAKLIASGGGVEKECVGLSTWMFR